MKSREENNQLFKNPKLALSILVFLFLALSFYAFNAFYKKYQIKKEISTLDARIIGIEKKKEDLQGLENALTDREYIEREARTKLNFKKNGEEVVVLVEKNTDEAGTEASAGKNKRSAGGSYGENAKKWIQIIFGR
ncbi:septum formation initiator family protein [Candidatus Azambacteria bacterium]|nr:septum formation initiator family protein [Candidatus Azambacteria bacterium]